MTTIGRKRHDERDNESIKVTDGDTPPVSRFMFEIWSSGSAGTMDAYQWIDLNDIRCYLLKSLYHLRNIISDISS